jgi:hypothetical protein
MAWFARFRQRLRNYTSSGDYAGRHGGGGGDFERDTRNAKAQGEAIAYRPDRYDGGGGFSP